MRLIDVDKLIDKLRDFKEWEDSEGKSIHLFGEWQRIDKCINITQAQPTVELPHWHDLKKNPEDLPEHGKYVLTKKNRSVSILSYNSNSNHWDEPSGTWWWSSNMVDKWIELPKDED